MSTPIPWSNEFLVNTTTALAQGASAVTDLATGRFVVTWTDESASADDPGWAVRAQMYNADGTRYGTEFLVNTATNDFQENPGIVALDDGRFVVAWEDSSSGGWEIRAQIFNADGSRSGSEFLVNSTVTGSQTTPAVTALAGGGFIVTWQDNFLSGGIPTWAVRAQMFDADGTRGTNPELLVWSTTADLPTPPTPTIAALTGGGFVATWMDATGDGSGTAIRAQLFDAAGTADGSAFVVNTTGANNQYTPVVCALANGGFVVAWTDEDIHARIFDADGAPAAPDFLANTTTAGYQMGPALAALGDGRFVVAWGGAGDVAARVFNGDGTAASGEFAVPATMDGTQSNPCITALPDGRIFVGWEYAGDVYGRIFDPRDAAVSITGTPLADSYVGTSLNDTLYGSAGNDTLDGAAGADILYGGAGNDLYVVDSFSDLVWDPVAGTSPVRASVSTAGIQANAYADYPLLTPGGRYLVFESEAATLVANDKNAANDVFVRDIATNQTTCVSSSSAGVLGNGASWRLATSTDGRQVLFRSAASNLVGSDGNAVDDLFVKNLATGQTTRVSTGNGGSEANGESWIGDLSADGRYVVFTSSATNLVVGDSNGANDVFVKDRTTGATTCISTSTGDAVGDARSDGWDITPDGNHVLFMSWAGNLVAGDTGGYIDVFVKNRASGETARVSTTSANAQANGDSAPYAISDDGRYVVFSSQADNLVTGDTNTADDVFLKDRVTGTTVCVSTDSSGNIANSDSRFYAMTPDARYLVFASSASNLVANDSNSGYDVFVKDRVTGATTRVSTTSTGAEGGGQSWEAGGISADGRFVVFESEASNLVAGDTNGSPDIFVKDVVTGAIARVSVSATGVQANASSWKGSITPDGRHVTFLSDATNLVSGDTNGVPDVFRVANPLLAGSGTDTVRTAISHVLGANIENLVLTGAAAVNGTGNALNNSLVGNTGANSLQGLTGNDTLNGGLGNDTLNGGVGTDTASYATATKGVTASLAVVAAQATGMGLDRLIGLENLTGSNFADKLTGNATANVLIGLAGNDTLTGNAGNDKLVGGLGSDALNGGLGRDVFRFDTAANTLTNKDTIAAFSVVDDSLQLENAVFTKVGLPGTLAAAAFWKSATAIAAHDATDRVIYNTTTGALYYDPDGTGPLAKVQFATLAGSPDTVTNADFQVT